MAGKICTLVTDYMDLYTQLTRWIRLLGQALLDLCRGEAPAQVGVGIMLSGWTVVLHAPDMPLPFRRQMRERISVSH